MNRIRIAAAVLVALTVGVAVVGSTPSAASPTATTSSRMRIGVVQASPVVQADLVSVLVDGTVVQATYLTGYVPIPGDRVVITQDGTDWFVLGGKSGYAGNLVVNGQMRAHPQLTLTASGPAYTWDRLGVSGPPTILIVSMGNASSDMAMGLVTFPASASASDSLVYSAAFPVTAGATLHCDLTGYVVGSSGILATATIRFLWFADGQTLPPGQLSETTLDTQTSTATQTTFVTIASTTVPAGITYARLAVRLVYAGGGGTGGQVTVFQAEAHQ